MFCVYLNVCVCARCQCARCSRRWLWSWWWMSRFTWGCCRRGPPACRSETTGSPAAAASSGSRSDTCPPVGGRWRGHLCGLRGSTGTVGLNLWHQGRFYHRNIEGFLSDLSPDTDDDEGFSFCAKRRAADTDWDKPTSVSAPSQWSH